MNPPTLTRAYIERVVAEEIAAAAPCSRPRPIDVYSMDLFSGAVMVRRRAFDRIIRETGCTPAQLAQVWGCSVSAIRDRAPRSQPPIVKAYDAATRDRLVSRWGWAHADAIIRGIDPATIADLDAWRTLGRPGGRAA